MINKYKSLILYDLKSSAGHIALAVVIPLVTYLFMNVFMYPYMLLFFVFSLMSKDSNTDWRKRVRTLPIPISTIVNSRIIAILIYGLIYYISTLIGMGLLGVSYEISIMGFQLGKPLNLLIIYIFMAAMMLNFYLAFMFIENLEYLGKIGGRFSKILKFLIGIIIFIISISTFDMMNVLNLNYDRIKFFIVPISILIVDLIRRIVIRKVKK